MTSQFDFVVIGSGLAGLSFALRAAAKGSVALITKRAATESNTRYAQGGIAAVLDPHDTFESHVADTLEAGAGLCRREIVEMCVRDAPARIQELISRGVVFTRAEAGGALDLGREGGHSNRRVVHAGDITGEAIEDALVTFAGRLSAIHIFEWHMAIDLITTGRLGLPGPDRVAGVYVLNTRSGEVMTLEAPVVCLATGGAGKVYKYTSNPDVATGDGIAMAWRAGAAIANMEFYQFHPTLLFHPQARSFLISEALRGEGGVLRLRTGEAFMARYHPKAELAPRDIVARAIDAELKRRGDDCVYLDMTHLDGAFLAQRFPNIHERCLSLGIDMRTQPIPVVPGAHYSCGGVVTDRDGETSIRNLFACGEAACTGLHGANRLASNSLLEAAVFGARAAESAMARLPDLPRERAAIPAWDSGSAVNSDEMVVVSQNWGELRRFMWNYVGIMRSNKRLARALHRIELLQEEVRQYYWDFLITGDLIELRNILDVAELIVRCALQRKESRGLHYSLDYPERAGAAVDSVISRKPPLFGPRRSP